MVDFLIPAARIKRNNVIEVYPKFRMYPPSKDLMIRGGDFYAVWVEEKGLWSTSEQDVLKLIDNALDKFKNENYSNMLESVKVMYMYDSETGSIDLWHKYCQKQTRDSFTPLDEKLIFSNTEVKKEDYASKKLPYPLEEGDCSAWDKLVGTLYSPEERRKLEWAIGAIVTGDSKNVQKFLALYGDVGTGKSTILNIIQQLFEGYCETFEAQALGSSTNVFALEAFKSNPLVAIQHDAKLSRIEDNTRLNSLISHESMIMNEKYKSAYSMKFNTFLIIGTNEPVKITDGKSGLLRRLIDVQPSGNKVPQKEYKKLIHRIKFELGAIAWHCREVYLEDPEYYDDYTPIAMISATNDFFNFMIDNIFMFEKEDGIKGNVAWDMYNKYASDAKLNYSFTKRVFKEELKNYFKSYDVGTDWYSGLRDEKFKQHSKSGGRNDEEKIEEETWLKFESIVSKDNIFERECRACFAQYANEEGTPQISWKNCKTTLRELETSRLHYVKVPENHIVIDFDIQNENGEKSLEKNVAAASKWPPTYAELSKSGAGIHLHYIYSGDPTKLSRIYGNHVEIKVFTGGSSLRRMLTKCTNNPITTISSGLPLKKGDKVINAESVKSERGLRSLIDRNLKKEFHPGTKPSIDFIYKILEDANDNGLKYDVTDMYQSILSFAAHSTHQADYCVKMVSKMKFKSDELPEPVANEKRQIVFFDIEVFVNLLIICWKYAGLGHNIVTMINPPENNVKELVYHYNLIGFNCRKYDNHILYARMQGYNNEELYRLSQRIINSNKENRNCLFGQAYNISYTDIYDFASAGNKKGLKKLEIEMNNISEEKLTEKGFSEEEIRIIKAGGSHLELGLPWNEPVSEDLWEKVAQYCANDVIATEAAFTYLKGDWMTRQMLADISGLSVNCSTNTHSEQIVFGNDKHPQDEFNYRNLAEPVSYTRYEEYRQKFGEDYNFRVWNAEGLPEYRDYIPGEVLPDGWSILPFFSGYEFKNGKSTYLGELIGEGGRVYAEPGMYGNVWDGDISGQHPATIRAEVCFGPKYTKNYCDIVDARLHIKHEEWDAVENMFDGKLKPYIQKVRNGEMTAKDLANAFKTIVNSAYGLTKASFNNPYRDLRNKDNLVAKRGALFMTLLTKLVQKKGYTVCHNKTDSIKVPDATPEIEKWIIDFGKEYGYSFETEARFNKYCLVNDAVYIAKTDEGKWLAVGAQFAEPYVFKTLFTHEPVIFNDLCQTKSVETCLYLDKNENYPDVSVWERVRNLRQSNAKKTRKDEALLEDYSRFDDSTVADEIARGHNYKFIGKVGLFCPVKDGCGGGWLMREKDGKYYAVGGTKGYRWLEAEEIKILGKEDRIDMSYFTKLVDDAVDTISQYGDFEWFVSGEPYVSPPRMPDFMNIPEDAPEEIPFNENVTDDEDDDILPFN